MSSRRSRRQSRTSSPTRSSRCETLTLDRSFEDVDDLALGRGEILVIAGPVGAGHTQLVETIFGMHPSYEGEIRLRGDIVRLRQPRTAMRQGITFVPGDRKTQGLVLGMSVLENATM